MVAGAAVRRVVSRAPEEAPDAKLQRPMGGKKDERIRSEAGDWVWDEFDRTLTLFTKLDGPDKGMAVRVTYKDGTREELEAMDPNDRLVDNNPEWLSRNRAEALEWMRTAQGEYQEDEKGRAARVGTSTSGPTMCNVHTGRFLGVMAKFAGGTGYTSAERLGGLDAIDIATRSHRAGAFHTIYSHPAGPTAGDVISYGKIEPGVKGGLRKANFGGISHIGVFKSARPGTGGTIWTVVDGGQGTYVSRQETRERTRVLSMERMIVEIPKVNASGKVIGLPTHEEMDCYVLKSALADAGQSKDDKLLRGWIDLDEFLGSDDAVQTNEDVSKASDLGAKHPVFAGRTPAPAPAAATP